ncbi:hypothetical protein ES705_17010 [subsurface metagenome]
MMTEVDSIKDQLIDRLWLPIALEGGLIFFPRLRKNKRMKLFTLTNDRNFNEIIKFENNKLTKRKQIVAWARDTFKKIRLETESIGLVLGGSLFEDSILSNSCPLVEHFPRDLINLDFSSQYPELENGRVEREINSLEKTIYLQYQKNGSSFVLLLTTLIDSNDIERDVIVQSSNVIQISGWVGLNIANFSQVISDVNEKSDLIKALTIELCQKYGYINIKSDGAILAIPRSREQLCSVVGIFRK